MEADDTLSSWRYRFSRKPGAGVKDRYSHVIAVDQNDGTVNEIASFKKDALPMLLFQFGNCLFPDAGTNEPVICSPISVKKYDGKTVIIKQS